MCCASVTPLTAACVPVGDLPGNSLLRYFHRYYSIKPSRWLPTTWKFHHVCCDAVKEGCKKEKTQIYGFNWTVSLFLLGDLQHLRQQRLRRPHLTPADPSRKIQAGGFWGVWAVTSVNARSHIYLWSSSHVQLLFIYSSTCLSLWSRHSQPFTCHSIASSAGSTSSANTSFLLRPSSHPRSSRSIPWSRSLFLDSSSHPYIAPPPQWQVVRIFTQPGVVLFATHAILWPPSIIVPFFFFFFHLPSTSSPCFTWRRTNGRSTDSLSSLSSL